MRPPVRGVLFLIWPSPPSRTRTHGDKDCLTRTKSTRRVLRYRIYIHETGGTTLQKIRAGKQNTVKLNEYLTYYIPNQADG